jgi:hypothetical protein
MASPAIARALVDCRATGLYNPPAFLTGPLHVTVGIEFMAIHAGTARLKHQRRSAPPVM